MKKDYRKLMDQKASAKRRSRKYLLVGTSLATGMLLGLAPISIATPLFTLETNEVYADLISGQLFSNLTSSNTSGTTSSAPYPLENTSRAVDFIISADSGIDLSVLPGNRLAVLAIPEEMQGLVTPNGDGTFSTEILLPTNALDPLLTVVNGAVTTLVNGINAALALNPLATVDLSQVYTQLDLLNNLSNLTAADVALQLEAQGDEYIYAELEGVLEVIIRESLTDILTDLNNAVQALQA
ncbi:adhesive domain-containing protein, partial [Enterococcus thailandicus]